MLAPVVPLQSSCQRCAFMLAITGTVLAAAVPQAPELARLEASIREAPNVTAGRAAATKYRDAVAGLRDAEKTWPLTEAESELCRVLAAEKGVRVGPYRRQAGPHLLVLAPEAWFAQQGDAARLSIATLETAFVLISDLTGADFAAARHRRLIVLFTPDRGGGSAQTLEGVVFASMELLGPPLQDQIVFHEFGHELFAAANLRPRFETWNEMWPELGRQYALSMLGRAPEFEANRARYLAAYREQFLVPGLSLEHLGPYDIGAGFLQTVVDAALRRGDDYDWAPLRAFFRRMRAVPAETDSYWQRQLILGWGLQQDLGANVADALAAAKFDLPRERLDAVPEELRTGAPFFARVQEAARAGDVGKARTLVDGADQRIAASIYGVQARAALGAALSAKGDETAARDAFRRAGYVVQWHVLGPFANQRGAAITTPLAPETKVDLAASVDALGGSAKWRALAAGTVTGYVDLSAVVQPSEEVLVYAYAEFRAAEAGEADLFTASDDQLAVFVNGALVATHPYPRGAFVDNDRARITVRRGTNSLLLKVGNLRGGFGFLARLAETSGRPWSLQ